jgi:hypothetical protein
MAGAAAPKPSPAKADEPKTPPDAPKVGQSADAAPEAPKASRRRNPREADELPPGLPHGYDRDAPRKKYEVLAAYVLDDDGWEITHGGIAELSDSLADRYRSVAGGYGDRTRQLIRPYVEPKADEDEG